MDGPIDRRTTGKCYQKRSLEEVLISMIYLLTDFKGCFSPISCRHQSSPWSRQKTCSDYSVYKVHSIIWEKKWILQLSCKADTTVIIVADNGRSENCWPCCDIQLLMKHEFTYLIFLESSFIIYVFFCKRSGLSPSSHYKTHKFINTYLL